MERAAPCNTVQHHAVPSAPPPLLGARVHKGEQASGLDYPRALGHKVTYRLLRALMDDVLEEQRVHAGGRQARLLHQAVHVLDALAGMVLLPVSGRNSAGQVRSGEAWRGNPRMLGMA